MSDCKSLSRTRAAFGLLLVASFPALSSCTPQDGRVPVFPVRGILLVGGEPAEGAIIAFHPTSSSEAKTTNPNGRVQADGTFELTTYESGDGAPAGEYVATIFWPEPPQSPIDHPAMGPDRLKNRYADPSTSSIRVSVSEGENLLEPIRLDAKGPRR